MEKRFKVLLGVLAFLGTWGYVNGLKAQVPNIPGIARVSSLPATCSVGRVVFKTSAPIGLHQCIASNTWEELSGGASGSVAGSDTQIQFNDGGAFGADSVFLWNKTTNALGIGQAAYTGTQFTLANTASTATNPFPVLQLIVQTNDTAFTMGGINLAYSTDLNNGWGFMQQDDGDLTIGAGASTVTISPASDYWSFTALATTLEDFRIRPGTSANTITIDSTTGATALLMSGFDITVNSCTGCSGSSTLDAITAAANNATINNEAFNIVWQWDLTADEIGFHFSEQEASTGGSGAGAQPIVKFSTLSGSTATPVVIDNFGASYGLYIRDVSGDTSPTYIDENGALVVACTATAGGFANNICFNGDGVLSLFSQSRNSRLNVRFTSDIGDAWYLDVTTAANLAFLTNSTVRGWFASNAPTLFLGASVNGYVSLASDNDGALTIAANGDGSDEDIVINLDDTANTAAITSTTGVTTLSFRATAAILAIDDSSFASTATLNLGTSSRGTVLLGGAGVTIEDFGDGNLTITGRGNGNDEGLNFDFDDGASGANAVDVTSSTGVTKITFGSIALNANGFQTNGTAGVTATTCTQFTLGICTAGSEPEYSIQELLARIEKLERQLANQRIN
jgi:hypothetical protein